MELTTGSKSLPEVKFPGGIFQSDALSPFLLVVTMMPLNYIVKKCAAGYKFAKSQGKINHQMYMDVIKLCAKNEKELEILTLAVRK